MFLYCEVVSSKVVSSKVVSSKVVSSKVAKLNALLQDDNVLVNLPTC